MRAGVNAAIGRSDGTKFREFAQSVTLQELLALAGRKVGVVTHVAAMIERICVQVTVERLGGGRSLCGSRAAGSPAARSWKYQDKSESHFACGAVEMDIGGPPGTQ